MQNEVDKELDISEYDRQLNENQNIIIAKTETSVLYQPGSKVIVK